MNKTVEGIAPEGNTAPDTTKILHVGLDWGTNTSCLQASFADTPDKVQCDLIPTVVGYAGEGMIDNLLPENARILFGQDALRHRLHLSLAYPMVNGVLRDLKAARDFAMHLRARLAPSPETEIRAVVGLPANADRSALESMRQTLAGIFDRIIVIPEPFLAALGYRDESRLHNPDYTDPVSNSLFIDSGAGTTDICLIQGYYPTAKDQFSFPFAGDRLDALLDEAVRTTYPDCDLSFHTIRELKEKYAFVGLLDSPVEASVLVGGKRRKLDLGPLLRSAGEELLQRISKSAQLLIARAPSDSVPELLQNIILTGGSSRIRHLDSELQRLLIEAGYENPRVSVTGENYKTFVAKGALKAARQARDDQWQQAAPRSSGN
ncbi:MAG TPA: rod shape-determining protein [Candidatus Paceibacterota bacterium]|nr:rod shape-determining protein [Candidatus Paceibacterota bacterium]HSA02390.1 rod shape-determining protein [Candidatus Paceibacterota bacterium]